MGSKGIRNLKNKNLGGMLQKYVGNFWEGLGAPCSGSYRV